MQSEHQSASSARRSVLRKGFTSNLAMSGRPAARVSWMYVALAASEIRGKGSASQMTGKMTERQQLTAMAVKTTRKSVILSIIVRNLRVGVEVGVPARRQSASEAT